MFPVVIVGGGIGGLTLALSLHQLGIACRVFEAAPEIRPLGVGVNLLPHGMRELTELGLQDRLASLAVETRELRQLARRLRPGGRPRPYRRGPARGATSSPAGARIGGHRIAGSDRCPSKSK